MKRSKGIGRRDFLRGSAALLGAGSYLPVARAGEELAGSSQGSSHGVEVTDNGRLGMSFGPGGKQKVWILGPPRADFQERLASKELARGLHNLGLGRAPIEAPATEAEPGADDVVFTLRVAKKGFKDPEAYEIVQEAANGRGTRVRLTGATPQAVLYAVFDFLERQGAFFGLAGEVYPLQAAAGLNLPRVNSPWHAQPRFKTRGLVPWPDFLNCVTVYNREDWRAYLEAMLRMRFNTLGVHVYSGAYQWAESFLSFKYGGVGHLAYTDTTATNRWGYLPEPTSHYGMGSPDFFAHEVFGSEATTRATSCWEDERYAQKLWGEAFGYAKQLGIRTGVGFEPYQIPDEIYAAVPPDSHYVSKNPKVPGPRLDPDSVAARDILDIRLGRLLEAYPMVDYVWLWEDEGMSWASQKEKVPLSVAPFQQAYDFLKRHAPEKHLVVSGWGGVVRHFQHFHQELPEDVIFSSLNDQVGWDPVSEEYAKLGSRERWPIPWLEDDPAMWLPQFHVHRGKRDADLAEKYGCQGLMGIHWRNHMMDADAGFQARASWDGKLKPTQYFQSFAAAHADGPRAEEFGEILDKTDRDRLILDSYTGKIVKGHHEVHGFAGDYGPAFEFWKGYDPPEKVQISQAKVAKQLRTLTDQAESAAERDRLDYYTSYVEFLVPYSDSWVTAAQLQKVLDAAKELKKAGKPAEARQKVQAEGVPLWLKLAPQVRKAILLYQEIVTERNEQGALASVHNKYERLALIRLRLSMKEYLELLPDDVEALFKQVRSRDPHTQPHVLIPTRPSALGPGEKVRIYAVATGGEQTPRVKLMVRQLNSGTWKSFPMNAVGRRTFMAELEGISMDAPLLEYYTRAEFPSPRGPRFATAPVGAPDKCYTVTLL